MGTTRPDEGRIRSMTGFGRAEREGPAGGVTVEVRSLNHRHLEVGLRAPREFLHLDSRLRKAVKDRCSRGTVDIFVALEEGSGLPAIDLDRARQTAESLAEVASIVGDSVRLEHVLSVPDVFQKGVSGALEGTADAVVAATEAALDGLLRQREEEGRVLAEDLLKRIGGLEDIKDQISGLARLVPEKVADQITGFLEKLDSGNRMDPQRLEAEIALLAQRADVTEELTRLDAHLDSIGETISRGGTAGRRIDFFVQEIYREINTIGSKAGIADISSLVVDFKTELEKLREQAQNIE